MKKLFGLTALTLSALALQAQTTQIVRWANTIGGNSTSSTVRVEDAIKGMVEDGQSNTYVIGNYTGTISFDEYTAGINGVAQTPMTVKTFNSVSGSQDVFIARYDINGTCTFATSIGGAGFDEGNAITMGNPSSPADFYITGMFNQSMTVEATTLNAVASGYQVNDAFIIKYNTTMTSRPTLSWKTAFGGYTETCGNGIAISGSNIYVTGYYTELVMDASSNILLEKTHIAGGGAPFSTPTPGYLEFPSRDMFVAKFTTAGAYTASLRSNASEDQVEGNGIAVLGSDLYVTGLYKGNVRFTGTTQACAGHSDAFVARYPLAFTTNVATNQTSIGGPSTTYQSAIEMPFYKQDAGYAICTSSFGVFVTGRFMDQITSPSAIDPSGSANETYMYLIRYNNTLAGAVTVNGTSGYSEGRGLYLATGGGMSPTHTLFVVGGAMSTSYINGAQIETNGYTAENTGFVARIGYTNSTATWANSFVDGIAQNQNGLNGTGSPDIKCVGFAVSYRVGCGVRVGGRFSGKTAFGNREKTCSGNYDAFLDVRENSVSVTASTFNCGGGAVVLTGTGGTSPMWTGPGVSSATTSVTVTPTSTSTYTFSASQSGSCANSVSPVTVFAFPSIASADAGPNQSLCGATHTTVTGSSPLADATYSWTSGAGGYIVGSPAVANPTVYVNSTTTFTMTLTDKCGSVTTDVVTVYYDPFCPHRTAGPQASGEQANIVVSPNPNNGQFIINTSNSDLKDVFVYDMTGRIVFSQVQTTDVTFAIDITSEAKGLYLVKVVSGENVQTEKISNQ